MSSHSGTLMSRPTRVVSPVSPRAISPVRDQRENSPVSSRGMANMRLSAKFPASPPVSPSSKVTFTSLPPLSSKGSLSVRQTSPEPSLPRLSSMKQTSLPKVSPIKRSNEPESPRANFSSSKVRIPPLVPTGEVRQTKYSVSAPSIHRSRQKRQARLEAASLVQVLPSPGKYVSYEEN